jgi:hypothetical protein
VLSPWAQQAGQRGSPGVAKGGSAFAELGKVLVDRVAGYPEQFCDGNDGVLRAGEQVAGVTNLLGIHRRRTAEAGAACSGRVQALVGPLDDEFADELCERGEDVEDESPAGGGGGVQGLM